MALTSTDKKEIETIARKEIREFLQSSTIRQFEDRLIDVIAKDIRRGKLEGETKDIVVRVFREFYQFMWTQRGYWEPRLKNA